ncbi:MAG: paaG [Pseudonocardiales bacterium]|nr:paaG [Pseudonocardiales bacterium]
MAVDPGAEVRADRERLSVRELAAARSLADVGFRIDVDDDGSALTPVAVVDGDSAGACSHDEIDAAARLLRSALAVIVVVGTRALPTVLADAADIVLEPERAGSGAAGAVAVDDLAAELRGLGQVVAQSPTAALSLMLALRSSAEASVADALAIESSTYSMLLAGREFRTWLAGRGAARPAGGPQRVGVERTGDTLVVTLVRADRRNAVDAAMRNALMDALAVAHWDDSLRVEIRADGPSFSAGGDLDEFGRADDVATAHLVRLAASVGQSIHDLRDRVTVSVHGACIGAGIELPAFAGRVVAEPGSYFQLPEVAMGLIPGAGGTVSITRRIGRQRTAWLALTGQKIDARQALEWGLIDRVL